MDGEETVVDDVGVTVGDAVEAQEAGVEAVDKTEDSVESMDETEDAVDTLCP